MSGKELRRSAQVKSRLSTARRNELARLAASKALEVRSDLGLPFFVAACPFDAAERLGVEVRFDPIPSMEGMYFAAPTPHIIVASERPSGRQRMTAAHELGHHAFGHGTRIDQLLELSDSGADDAKNDWSEDEFLADAFAAFFLMPKAAVERGFRDRGVEPAEATALTCYEIAGWLGVGYAALINHMAISLRLISRPKALELQRKPKLLRAGLLGRKVDGDVYVINAAWKGRPIDLRVGDIAIVSESVRLAPSDSQAVTVSTLPNGRIEIQAVQPGVARIAGACWAEEVRISERQFAGRNIYRHLEPIAD